MWHVMQRAWCPFTAQRTVHDLVKPLSQVAGDGRNRPQAHKTHRSVPMEYGGGREYDLEKEFGPVPKAPGDIHGTGKLLAY